MTQFTKQTETSGNFNCFKFLYYFATNKQHIIPKDVFEIVHSNAYSHKFKDIVFK